MKMDEAREKFKDIKFKWVRGHNGDFYNEMADELSTDYTGELKQFPFKQSEWEKSGKAMLFNDFLKQNHGKTINEVYYTESEKEIVLF